PLNYSFSEDVKKRYESMNWQVICVQDGNDYEAIAKAIKKAKKEVYKPTLIIVNTIIGFGSRNQGTSKVHDAHLGEEDVQYAKRQYGFEYDNFFVPEEVYDDFKKNVFKRGKRAYNKWNKMMDTYKTEYPELYQELFQNINDEYSFDETAFIKEYQDGISEATRVTSEKL